MTENSKQFRRVFSEALFALLFVISSVTLVAVSAYAVQPDEIMSDPKLEKKAREISLGLRCLVCQNQSIDDSDAPLARDLRLLVRERLKAGDTNEQVVDFVVARYGDFVLLKPPFNLHTVLLWLAPLMLLIGAIILARRTMIDPGRVAGRTSDSSALSDDEKASFERNLVRLRRRRRET